MKTDCCTNISEQFAQGVREYYGATYEKYKLSTNEMKLLAIMFAAKWDIDHIGYVSKKTMGLLREI